MSLVTFGCSNDGAREPAETAAPEYAFDDDIEDYLAAFPFEQYEVFDVPRVGKFYVDDNAANVKAAIRSGNAWEPHVIALFEKYAAPGTTVLDVGAHIGSLTVPLARLVGPEGRVYAFEPQIKVFRELVYNLRLNELNNAIPLRLAVSSEPGVVEMSPTRRYDGRARIGEGGDVAEKRTLDSFGFTDVSVVKIDVEGHEAEVLTGAASTIAASRPVIIVEIFEENFEHTKAILERFGYSVRRIRGRDFIALIED